MKHPSGYTIEDVIEAGKERRVRFDFDEYQPDFMGLVSLNSDRGWPITSGVRPAHQVTPEISPEHYPHCLSIGGEININEGSKVIGRVKVLEVYNELLLASS